MVQQEFPSEARRERECGHDEPRGRTR
jgi:hypothetical protein